jgi:hypothetical protein
MKTAGTCRTSTPESNFLQLLLMTSRVAEGRRGKQRVAGLYMKTAHVIWRVHHVGLSPGSNCAGK